MEKSYLQAQAELSRFDYEARIRKNIEQAKPYVEPEVIPHRTTIYDFGHPDADWTGEVPIISRKKNIQQLISTEQHQEIKSMKKSFKTPSNSDTFIDKTCPWEKLDTEDWKTAYQVQTNQSERTNTISARGVKHVIPPYENYSNNKNSNSINQIVGKGSQGNSSFLKGLGSRIVSSNNQDLKKPEVANKQTSSASNKVLIAENYHNFTLGYTGNRKN